MSGSPEDKSKEEDLVTRPLGRSRRIRGRRRMVSALRSRLSGFSSIFPGKRFRSRLTFISGIDFS